MAILHTQLQQDCFYLGRLELCHLLLMNDCQYPWCILVPDRENISEIYQLPADEQIALSRESALLAAAMMTAFAGEKMNIAALGNVVPQLHVHHIARFRTDPAWPAPVWGKLPVSPYSEQARQDTIIRLRTQLADKVHWSTTV